MYTYERFNPIYAKKMTVKVFEDGLNATVVIAEKGKYISRTVNDNETIETAKISNQSEKPSFVHIFKTEGFKEARDEAKIDLKNFVTKYDKLSSDYNLNEYLPSGDPVFSTTFYSLPHSYKNRLKKYEENPNFINFSGHISLLSLLAYLIDYKNKLLEGCDICNNYFTPIYVSNPYPKIKTVNDFIQCLSMFKIKDVKNSTTLDPRIREIFPEGKNDTVIKNVINKKYVFRLVVSCLGISIGIIALLSKKHLNLRPNFHSSYIERHYNSFATTGGVVLITFFSFLLLITLKCCNSKVAKAELNNKTSEESCVFSAWCH